MSYPSQAEFTKILDYNLTTGVISWKNTEAYYPGMPCLQNIQSGYLCGRLTRNGKSYFAHRVAYIMAHGSIPDGTVIDHINGDRTDNRAANLRAVTREENNQNRRYRKHKTRIEETPYGTYKPIIVKGKRQFRLGTYDSHSGAETAIATWKHKLRIS